MQRKLCFCCFFLLLLLPLVLSTHHENPADVLVEMINRNRTARKVPKLNESPGLGCMALQFAKSCNCSKNGTADCSSSEDDFTEIFAPNCGLELPTLAAITGRVVACRKTYVGPPVAFSELLFRPKILANRSHSQVGVGLVGRGHGPFFWCVLFGGGRVNSSFVLEDGGVGIWQKRGCYSGSSFPCSAGLRNCWDFSFTFLLLLLLLLLLPC